MLKIATLFSGIGAPEQAAKRVWPEHEVVFACEIDKFARQSYRAIYCIDEERFHEDVTQLDGMQYRGEVDLLVWGFPCQDYSMAGKRAGLNGQRGTLFYDGARITKEVRPRWFLAENVKGLLSSHGGEDFEVIMDILRNDVGYYCTWVVLNTKDYGVPQNRERVFIVGFRDHDEYMRFQFPTPIPLEKRLKDILESNVEEKYYLSEKAVSGFMFHKQRHEERGNGFKFEPTDGSGIASSVTTRTGSRPTDNFIAEQKIIDSTNDFGEGKKRQYDKFSPCLRSERSGLLVVEPKIIDDQGRKEKQKNPKLLDCCPTLRAESHGNEPKVVEPKINVVGMLNIKAADICKRVYGADGIAPTFQTCQGGHREPKIKVRSATKTRYETAMVGDSINFSVPNSKTRRGRVGKQVAQTLDTACNQGVVEPRIKEEQNFRIRKLSPLESWRLQDFPDEAFRKAKNAGVSDSQLYKQAGNSMSVNVIEAIFQQIEKTLHGEPTGTLLDFAKELEQC